MTAANAPPPVAADAAAEPLQLARSASSSSRRARWVPRVRERSKLVEVEECIEHADAVCSWLKAARAFDSDTPDDWDSSWPAGRFLVRRQERRLLVGLR